MSFRVKSLAICLAIALFSGCQPGLDQVTGPSATGLTIALSAIPGTAGIPADGVSQSTIRVEVFRSNAEMVDKATVTLTTTKGTLGSTTLTTTNGVAVTTLTSSTTTGTATIVATVENVSARAIVQMVNITGKV